MQGFLNDYVRHEIEHVIDALEGNEVETPEGLTPFEYYTQPHEVRAQKAGFKRRAKIEKSPVEDVVKGNGFSVVEDYTGHGVGRNLHEEPSVFNFRTNELPNVVLREGMTLAVEPIVNQGSKFCKTLNDKWTVITKDGKLSAQWEHTIVVMKDGIEILTDRDF